MKLSPAIMSTRTGLRWSRCVCIGGKDVSGRDYGQDDAVESGAAGWDQLSEAERVIVIHS